MIRLTLNSVTVILMLVMFGHSGQSKLTTLDISRFLEISKDTYSKIVSVSVTGKNKFSYNVIYIATLGLFSFSKILTKSVMIVVMQKISNM